MDPGSSTPTKKGELEGGLKAMDGFMYKKGAGTGIFGSGIGGRHNWLRRWFVLQDDFLFYYENFDRDANDGEGAPVNQKGVVPIRNCEVKKFPHRERDCCFVIQHPERRTVYLQAESEKLMSLWMSMLKKASQMDLHTGHINTDEYYRLLGFDPADIREQGQAPSDKELNKAYRKACIRAHPDKGGDPVLFDKLQEANEVLKSIREAEIEAENFEHLEFSGLVTKGRKGVGLGLIVQEEKSKGLTVITRVVKGILESLDDPEKFGSIQAQDILVAIGSERIRGWPLHRVTERLNEFRVPVGSSIRMTFARKIRKRGGRGEEAKIENPADFYDESQDESSSLLHQQIRRDQEHLRQANTLLEQEVETARAKCTDAESQAASLTARVRELEDERELMFSQLHGLQTSYERVIGCAPRESSGFQDLGHAPQLEKEHTMEAACRRAVAAAEAADPSGTIVSTWSTQGDSAAAKLRRLEAKLLRLGLQTPATGL